MMRSSATLSIIKREGHLAARAASDADAFRFVCVHGVKAGVWLYDSSAARRDELRADVAACNARRAADYAQLTRAIAAERAKYDERVRLRQMSPAQRKQYALEKAEKAKKLAAVADDTSPDRDASDGAAAASNTPAKKKGKHKR